MGERVNGWFLKFSKAYPSWRSCAPGLRGLGSSNRMREFGERYSLPFCCFPLMPQAIWQPPTLRQDGLEDSDRRDQLDDL